MEIKMALCLPRDAASVPVTRRVLDRCLETLGVTPDTRADPVPATAEHGRGLTIIHAVADNLQLTGNERHGTTVHFEKTLEWLPGVAGQYLFNADGDS